MNMLLFFFRPVVSLNILAQFIQINWDTCAAARTVFMITVIINHH